MEKYKICQSCGMPLKRDEHGGGTNADGSRSTVYCSNCFQKGEFTFPNITAREMREMVQKKLSEVGIPQIITPLFTRSIPKLKRWTANQPNLLNRV